MKKILLEALAINAEKISTIAVVGGGGKTSLIFRLMESFVSIGKKVIVTTTTHMAYEPERPFVEDGDIDGVWKDLQRYHYTVAASLDRATEKIGCLSEEKLEELRGLADVLLIEADGAKRLPLKVPGEREPVIPEFAEMVIGVVGVDALGEPIQKTCHRSEKVADFLGKGMEEVVTEDDIVKIAVSAEALRKCVDGREYCVLLNKADIRGKAEAAERIAGKLEEQGVHAVWGSLQKQNYNSICNCIDRTEEKAEVWMNKLQEPQNKGSQAQEKPTFIMLAAGNSRRFGSNKLLYEIGGVPMYLRTLHKLQKAASELGNCEIIVVTQYEEIASKAQESGVRVLINSHPETPPPADGGGRRCYHTPAPHLSAPFPEKHRRSLSSPAWWSSVVHASLRDNRKAQPSCCRPPPLGASHKSVQHPGCLSGYGHRNLRFYPLPRS